MGLLLSICKHALSALHFLLPIRRRTNRIRAYHPNHVSPDTMRAQIESRIHERMIYFEIGLRLLVPDLAMAFARNVCPNLSDQRIFIELANIMCYTFVFPYAELWVLDPREPSEMYLGHYFVRNLGMDNNYSLESERAMRDMGHTTKNFGNVTTIREVAGIAIVDKMTTCASDSDILSSFEAPRKKLISRAGFKYCLAIPVVRDTGATHAFCFFRKRELPVDKEVVSLMESLLEHIFKSPSPRSAQTNSNDHW